MRDTDYEFIRQLVYHHSRINLGTDKRELVSARLGKRLRATNIPSITEYCRFLQEEESRDELSHLIDAISTNHTYFFREDSHFNFLRDVAIPEMVNRRRDENWSHLQIWSAASSSGEEPYSLAITLAEKLGLNSNCPWKIEATDISHKILQKAAAGVYRIEALSKTPPNLVRTYFQKGYGPQDGNYRIKPQLSQKVTFRQLNLLDRDTPFKEPFQIIFCRNVMIYFDRPTQEELVNKLSQLLVPGGYLMVGHSESLTGINHPLDMLRPATYRKPFKK
ncbi:MAG TPA: protein-glutamate O-methyltransferase CheR [Opitutaceae bacterium]|nr:protein-glutamate O-methyltransferase CheR [Opitutaceae bacterium]